MKIRDIAKFPQTFFHVDFVRDLREHTIYTVAPDKYVESVY